MKALRRLSEIDVEDSRMSPLGTAVCKYLRWYVRGPAFTCSQKALSGFERADVYRTIWLTVSASVKVSGGRCVFRAAEKQVQRDV